MAATKYLDYDGLLYFWGKLKAYFAKKATTLSGYGITDAKIASGTITLGSNTITPLTSASSLNAAKLTGTASVDTTGKATTAGTADQVANSLALKVKTGTTEGTDLYTYNGSGAKTLDIKQGSNITLTAAAGQLTIAATNTTYSAATTSAAGLMSAADKTKLNGIATGAEVNVIEGVKVNSAALTPDSKIVSIPNASTSAYGCTKLSSATNSTSTSLAATASAVKAAYDLANGKQSPATTLAGCGITDAYTKTEVDSKLTSAMHYKGSVATVADLPSSNNQTGDFYNVTATGENYAWTGSDWDVTGSIVDLAAITNSEIDTVVAS